MSEERLRRALETLGLATALAVAGLLRLGWAGVHSFGYDEARVSLMALQMARGGQFASVGMPSSAGAPNPPGFVWLMSAAYALSTDPLVASLLVGALNVLAVWGVWRLARRAWGPWAALAASLLLATSPWGVFYSRSVWSQDLLAPLAVLWALLGVRGIRRESGPLLAAHLFVGGFAWQVHYAGIVLLPASAWLLIRYRLWRRWPWILAGLGAAALALAPFAGALLRAGGMPLSNVTALPAEGWRPSWEAIAHWAEMGMGANWERLPLGWDWRWPPTLAGAQRLAQGITGALIALGLAGLIRHAWHTRRAPQAEAEILATLLPAWALIPPLAFTLSGITVHPQYQLAALPALALAAGGAVALLPARWRWRGPLVAGLALAVALPQALSAAISLEANRTRLQPGGLGTPLAYPRAAVAALRDGTPILVHAAHDDPAYDADAAGMSVLLWGYPHRLVNGTTTLLLPPEGEAAYLLLPFAELPAYAMAQDYAQVQATLELPRRQGEPPYVALRVAGGAPHGLRVTEPVALANGAVLRGWDAQWRGDQLTLVTWWEVTEALQSGRYHQFNHLYVGEDATPAQVQDTPISSGSWEAGDQLITWARFAPEAPGPYRFAVGMYRYPELTRIPKKDGEGDTIVLGPIE